MPALRYVVLTVGVVALIGLAAYAPMILGVAAHVSSGTVSSTCTTRSVTTTQTTTTSTSTQGSFSYTPSTPVRVDSVVANLARGSGEEGTVVSFAVAYENVGATGIYYIAGCDSSLVPTLPAGNGVLQQTSSDPRCLCAEAVVAMPPGANRTAYTPGCWSGYRFVLVHPGTVVVDFTLYWGSTQANQPQDATNITATFTFA